MKKLNLLLFFLLAAMMSFGQSSTIPYQAVARDASGALIQNETVFVQFNIRNNTPTGPILYAEAHTVFTNEFGLINVNIGSGTALIGTFSSIPWNSGSEKYMDIYLAHNGPYVLMGTVPFSSVPLALHANTATTATTANTATTVSGSAGGDVTGPYSNLQLGTQVVTNTELADNCITTNKVGDFSISTPKLGDLAVTTQKLADNAVSTVKLADNSVSGSKIAMGGDLLGDIMYYDGADYVRLPRGTTGQFLTVGASGLPVWQTMTGQLIASNTVSASSVAPTASLAFLSGTLTVNITSATQKVYLVSTCSFGALATAATGLNIYPGYKSSLAATPSQFGGGIFGLTCPANNRMTYTISGIITGLAPGTYQFGMVGSSATPANWNNNEWSYTSVLVYN